MYELDIGVIVDTLQGIKYRVVLICCVIYYPWMKSDAKVHTHTLSAGLFYDCVGKQWASVIMNRGIIAQYVYFGFTVD